MRRFIIFLAFALTLTGCEGWNGTTRAISPAIPIGTTFVLVDAASIINTQKTIDDHLVSWLTGMDCSTIRASHGDHYCLEPPDAIPVIIRTSYCYKSIANVSCYEQPFPQDSSRLYGVRIDRIPANQYPGSLQFLPTQSQSAATPAPAVASAQMQPPAAQTNTIPPSMPLPDTLSALPAPVQITPLAQ